MNKNLIAIAITAALAVPSIAAAEVKIIGQAQLEVVNTASDVAKEGLTLDDSAEGKKIGSGNASALGITGSHDLGNGMTGLYKVNFNFYSDDRASGTLTARDKFVGLKGDFGTFLMGTINNPYKTATVKYDPFLATFMQARGNNGMSTLHNSYVDNVLAYANKFGSAKLVAAIAFDESDGTTAGTPAVISDADNELDGDHTFAASLNMPIADSLELALGFMSTQNDTTGVDTAGSAVKVGVKWTSGDMTVAGHFESLDEELGDQSNIFVSASMKMGAGASISASFGSQTDESDADTKDGTYTAIGYKKALSKKVSWHAGIVISDEGVAGPDEDITRIGAGMRVKF